MFGGLGRINAERQRNVLALLNDDRLTPDQKAAFCYDEGICDGCGVKVCWVGPFKRRPYTNERVSNGICRSCYPEKCAAADANSSSGATAPWGKMQNLVVPPDVLMAKTSDAFSSLQSSVSEGINNLNETVNSDKAKAFRTESVKAFDSVSSSVAGGINVLNESIKKNTENMDMSGTTKAFKEGSTRAINNLQTGVNNIKSRTIQKQKDPNQQQQKADLANLKMKFKTNNEELSTKGTAPDELSLKENNEANTPKSENDPPATLKGKMVKTPYGEGVVNDYRSSDEMFVIALHHPNSGTSVQQEHKTNNTTKLFCKRETFDVVADDEKSNSSKNRQKQSMELNEAYESLEKMRRLNLEVQCQERGIVGPIDFNKCTHCLLNPELDKNDQEQQQQQPQSFRRIRNLIDNNKTKKVSPCMFCGNPTCEARHACPAFRKEGITACQDCVKLFESDYIVACINQAHGLSVEMASIAENQGVTETRPLDHMMDLYDRVLLLLQYSSQYINSIATALEENTKRGNNVNMGASSVGIVSGALGVAAACTIFTPAGPPLLVASLMLGGGATAAQTGTEVVNYFSEPNKFADKIIALIGMVHSLLRVKESLREILTARLLQEQGNPDVDKLKQNLEKLRKKQVAAAVKAGTTVASTAVLGGVAGAAAGAAAVESAAIVSSVEVGALAGRQANMLTKSGTAVARGARFARFAGGALSAATILLEAKTMHNTIEQINLGHPCEKANALRAILKEIPTLPTTEQLDEECRIYVGAMSNRVNATSLEDAINLIESKAIQEWQVTKAQLEGSDSELAPEGVSIVDGEDQSEWESVTGALSASLLGNSVQSTLPTDADSVVTPPVPKMIDATPIPLSESQSSPAPTASHIVPPARLTQSMSALPPPEPTTPSTQSQSALLDRIKKFKQEESFGSTGRSNAAPAS